jgi:DNA mismatch repair protein MutS
MSLDEAARRNLELERTARTGEKRGSLLWALDCTRTPMGSRLMRQWLLRPSLDAAAIGARHDAVEALTHRHAARAQLRRALRGVHDLERLLTRVETRRASPRCVAAVANSLAALADVDGCLRALAPTAAAAADGGAAAGAAAAAADAAAANVAALLAPPADGGAERLRELAEHIRATLVASPPARLGDGACIGDGAAARHAPLAAARADAAALGAVLATVEAREAAASGLAGGVRCISVRGELVLSVKGAAALDALGARAPAHWLEVPCAAARGKERRFVTHEMRAAEAKLARVSARIAHLEAALFDALLDRVDARAPDARAACARAARADVLSAFAHTAVAEGYCRPAVLPLPRAEDAAAAGAGHVMRVERARHPVVERLLADGAFVSNPINLGAGAAAGAGNGNGGGGAGGRGVPDLLVLTGPNAGGKSVYLRTLGVLQILAQAGSFVPADAATLTVADRLFTRVGAVDDIGGGQSTFTVEMRETAEILRHATRASLVLLDEVGRGTAAADGVAIARAVAEHLASSIGCRALFATHLHELCDLPSTLPNVGAAQMGVVPREPRPGEPPAAGGGADDAVEFTYKLVPGAATHSHGLHAARVAGFPPAVLRRAQELLSRDARARGSA